MQQAASQHQRPSNLLMQLDPHLTLEQKQRQLTKNLSPRRLKKVNCSHDEESTSSELGSLNDSVEIEDESTIDIQSPVRANSSPAKAASGLWNAGGSSAKVNDNTVVLLYVIKLTSNKGGQGTEREITPFEYFKMRLDCIKCAAEGDNDEDLRKFRRRVKRKLALNDNFKIYNYQGHPIQDDELSYLNQEGSKIAVVYVSSSAVFDFDLYIRMFHEIKKLGEGGFGSVVLGQHIITKQLFAIKQIYPAVFKADEVLKAYKEAQVLQNLKHQNVIKLYNVCQLSDSRIILLMEYLTGGSLREFIDSAGGKLTESEAQKALYEIGNALNYCHQRRIVHRDIKLENIMLRQRDDLSGGLVIIDFGIAGRLQNINEKLQEGTIRYVPPELLTGASYKPDQSFDVWSLGILMYRVVYGCYPFDGPTFKDIKESIIKCELNLPPQAQGTNPVSDTCFALIRLMLNKDPKKRPKLYQLIQHDWFSNSKFQQMMNVSMFQQNTMMDFFKQEMMQIENTKQAQAIQSATKSMNIQINEDSFSPEPLVFPGGLSSQLKIPQSREKRNKAIDLSGQKKFINISPSPVHIRTRQQLAESTQHDYAQQHSSFAVKQLPKEDSISSLSLKKQQLSDIRNFFENNLPQGTKEFQMNVYQMQKEDGKTLHKRVETQHKRNPNISSVAHQKTRKDSVTMKGQQLPSFSRMVLNPLVTSSNSNPPSRFNMKSESIKEPPEERKLKFDGELVGSKYISVLDIIESQGFVQSLQQQTTIDTPHYYNRDQYEGDSKKAFEFPGVFDSESKKSPWKVLSLNMSGIKDNEKGSNFYFHASKIGKNKDFTQAKSMNPSTLAKIRKQHDFRKFITKLPSQAGASFLPQANSVLLKDQIPKGMGSQLTNLSQREKMAPLQQSHFGLAKNSKDAFYKDK